VKKTWTPLPAERMDPGNAKAQARALDRANLARFKDAKGDWLDADWPTLRVVVVCRTPGCKRNGVEYEVEVHENVDGVVRSVCGPCRQPHAERGTPDAAPQS
jgi:hypothetical protein